MGGDYSSRPDADVMMSIQKIRGAAIMLALWALFLLSALVISWALDIDSRLSISGDATRMLKAEAVACSGAEVALHPAVNPGSRNLSGQLNNGASYEARLTGEGGRLDINWLTAGEDSDHLEILRRYLENKGIDLNERDTMIDSLLDWVEPNTGLHRLNAQPESDTYHPAHAPLTRIDELKQIAGWADFTSVPGWDDDFTVNTRTGVDMTWASRDVLLALPGMTPQVVDRFLQLRQGPDGIDGTEDDTVFKSNEQIRATLGLNQEQFNSLQKVLSPNVPVPIFRVVSVGRAGKATRTVQMVFRRVGFAPSVITWKEF
jgi:general secretion pathway protein K